MFINNPEPERFVTDIQDLIAVEGKCSTVALRFVSGDEALTFTFVSSERKAVVEAISGAALALAMRIAPNGGKTSTRKPRAKKAAKGAGEP